MTAEEYIRQELLAGRLTYHHIQVLTTLFQTEEKLTPDGMPGPATRARIDYYGTVEKTPPDVAWLRRPLPDLVDPNGNPRPAQVTSEFRPPDRPTHTGLDWFYRWQIGDQPNFVGDKGGAGRQPDGTPKWVVPYGLNAVAAADGVVQSAGNSPTGYRVWIDHGNGFRTGYFHLLGLIHHTGDRVKEGESLGPVGDNPADNDGRHLHFELSPSTTYAPLDPAPYIRKP